MGRVGSLIDYSRLPAKFSSQCFNLGGFAPGQGLSRGDVVDAKLEWIDLPVAENPIPLENLSPRLKQLLNNWERYMILEPNSRKTIGKVRSYEDPLFRSKRGKLGLAKLLYGANMLRVVSRQRGPAVKCFTVLKKVNPDGSMSLRLVFDLRGTNCEFCPAPFCNLANAANFAYIDLSSDVIGDGRLIAWQGDIPNFFYKLQIPHGLSEFFCLEGVNAKELYSALGKELPPGTVGNKLAIQVVCMGWSWAPYLAQTAAEDVLSSVPQILSSRETSPSEPDDDVSSDIRLDDDLSQDAFSKARISNRPVESRYAAVDSGYAAV